MAAVMLVALTTAVAGVPALVAKPASVSRPTQLLSGIVVDPLDALASLRSADPGAAPRDVFEV